MESVWTQGKHPNILRETSISPADISLLAFTGLDTQLRHSDQDKAFKLSGYSGAVWSTLNVP